MNDLVRKTEVINELVALTAYNTKLEITKVVEADLSRMDKWLGGVEDCLNAIEAIQPVDAVPVVRCKYCKYNLTPSGEGAVCDYDGYVHKQEWFCADGKRKERTDDDER